MTEVKPWEPVMGGWQGFGYWDWGERGRWDCKSIERASGRLHVTLANGQRLIVRALSEDRKAARAMQKRVNKAVEANR